MTFKEIEKLKIELAASLPNLFGKTKLFMISEFYSTLLNTKDNNLIDAYSLDFIVEYLAELKLFTPFFLAPQKTEQLIMQLNELKSIPTLTQFGKEYDEIIQSINNQLEELNNILTGNHNSKIRTLTFPLLEISQEHSNQEIFGTLESVCIKIHKTKHSTRFVFVPSEKKIEERLLNQAKISYQLALDYFQYHKRKISSHHEVLIYFENLAGSYEGNSLGVALSIGFIEQLSILYNLPYITNIKNNVSSTGGIDESGNITLVSKEIIEKKIEVVFYSDIETFIIPKEDEEFARDKRKLLQEQYPNRKLKLIAIDDINDLLNRRDLVDIKKQPKIIRAAKSIRKHWLPTILILLLILIMIFIYVRDYDDNPFDYRFSGNTIFITNSHKKVLFEFNGTEPFWDSGAKFKIRFVDIDKDGNNEVIYCGEKNGKYGNILGRILCFNKQAKMIWQYEFHDTISSAREKLVPPYQISIIDTVTKNNSMLLYLIGNNLESYSGSIFTINLMTGKRVGNTFWNAGHIATAIVDRKLNGLGITIIAVNNGFNANSIMKLKLEKLNGQSFSREDYNFLDLKKTGIDRFVLLPNTDYSKLINIRFSAVNANAFYLSKSDSSYNFVTVEDNMSSGLIYKFDQNLICNSVFVQDGFSVVRDKAVKTGKLKAPYTDTQEYRALIKNQIRYWEGNKFVNHEK